MMKRLWIPMVVALTLAPLAASSPAEMLEKAIYTEETLGDLPAAIELYRGIVEDAAGNRRYAAEALLRLGQAEGKNGNLVAARKSFRRLIDEFPELEELVAQARAQMPEPVDELALGGPPWEAGELLRYDMKLLTGVQVGGMIGTVQRAIVNGEDAWRIELRRVAVASKDNQATSRVDVAADDYEPISGWFKHTKLGEFRMAYRGDRVHHETVGADGEIRTREIPIEGTVYDNEQSMYLLRQLPLEEGFRTSLSILPFHGEVLPIEVEVTARETVEVPAGSFDAYRLEMSIGQVFWISAAPGRHVVKFEADGVAVELAEVGRVAPGEPTVIGAGDAGYGLTLPSGWHTFEVDTGRATSRAILLLDPGADSLSTLELGDAAGQTLDLRVERELEGCKRRFVDYALRDEGVQTRTIADRSAKSFVGDYKDGDRAWVQYRVYVIADEVAAEFIFRTPAERFEALRETFDAIVESYQAG